VHALPVQALAVINIALGILILSLPQVSLATLAVLVAVSLLARGAFMSCVAARPRSERHDAAPLAPAAA
jgi:uncharacterized membrane protein HdeD (DUF308 family)